MSWRTVVVTGVAKLDYKLDYLVVRKKDNLYKVHLSEIGLLLIESTSVSVTAVLLCELIQHKVKVIFCDEKHNPVSELMPYYGGHDTSAKVKKQISWRSWIKESVWTEIVTEKIKQQRKLLDSRGLVEEANLLNQYISEIRAGDESNREGHAAKVYFNALFGKSFTRSEENSINAALNYGYGILLSYFNREVVSNGYITQLGIFHDNMFNQFNLSSDLMEPFRPLIDAHVIMLDPQKFEHEEKIEMLKLFDATVVMNGKFQHIGNAIKIYVKSVFEALNEEEIALIQFYRNEL